MYNFLIKFIKRIKNFGDFDIRKQMKRENVMMLKSSLSNNIYNNYQMKINVPFETNNHNISINNSNDNSNNDDSSSPVSATTTAIPIMRPIIVIKNKFLLTIWHWLSQFHKTIGIIFALCSVLFWSFNGLSYKLNPHLHALEILMISSLFVAITYLIFMFTFYGVKYRSSKPTINDNNNNNDNVYQLESFNWSLLFGIPGERISLCMRCLCGTISLACFYSSYRYIPLGDATTIRFTSPVFIAIFAHFMVNEPFGMLQVINALTTLIGVVLIGRPSFIFGSMNQSSSSQIINDTTILPSSIWPAEKRSSNEFNESISELFDRTMFDHTNETESSLSLYDWSSTLFGVFLSLIAAISISISMIFMRKIRRTPPPLVIFWFSLSNVVLGAVGLFIIDEYRMPIGLECWTLIIMTTICTGLDQFFITLALKMENAGAVAIIQALCVVLSFIFSISILHEPLYWTSALGGTFIFFSVLVLGCSKLLQELNYSNIKSTIFAINILHTNSAKFNLDDTYCTKLSNKSIATTKQQQQQTINMNNSNIIIKHYRQSSSSSLNNNHHYFNNQTNLPNRKSLNEPYLLSIVPILNDYRSQQQLEQQQYKICN